jgi:hypothetical protein
MKSFLETEYNLKVVPFNIVDPTATMAGRNAALKAWQQIIRQRVGQKNNSYNFIIGDYGSGKSFTLFKIVEDVKKEYKDRILPISTTLLSEDTVNKFGLSFIQRLFDRISDREIEGVLKKVSKNDLEHLKQVLPDPGIIFEKIKKGDKLPLIFLRGDRSLDKKEMNDLGVLRKINSTDKAKDYFLAFLHLLKLANIDTIVLAIDEVEYLFSQMKGAKLSLVFNTLRGIYDLQFTYSKALELTKIANIICFFAISEDGWRRLNEMRKRESGQGGPINPFLDRKDIIITLLNLSKQETLGLIEYRLSDHRVKDAGKNKLLIPFEDKFIDYIYALTAGKPRFIVDRCDIVLREGLEQKIPLITVDFAKKVYESHGLVTETK